MGRKHFFYDKKERENFVNLELSNNTDIAKSGTQFLLSEIEDSLKEYTPSVLFLEHSYYCTALKDKNCTVYVALKDYDKKLEEKDIISLSSFFNNLETDFEIKFPTLWHQEFIRGECENIFKGSIYLISESASTDCKNTEKYNLPSKKCDQTLSNVETTSEYAVYFGANQSIVDYIETMHGSLDSSTKIEENIDVFRSCYDRILKKDEGGFSYLYAIPIVAYPYDTCYENKQIKILLQGSIWIYCVTAKEISDLSFHKSLVKKISGIVKDYSINFIFKKGLELTENARKEAIKSAKAAIMSRNMSHNLGSHVMFYIKQKLQSVQKIAGEGVLKNLDEYSSQDDLIGKLKSNEDLQVELPFLVGLGRFLNYLQERQDYIATISTNYIPANSTINFKDFVYDELKPDLRYKRHNDVKGVKPRNLLLDFIAYSEGYVDSDSIVINFGDFNGVISNKDATIEETEKKIEKLRNEITEAKFPEELQQKLENSEVLLKELKYFRELRKFDISLPGGVIGRQAIFSIMENIIRNSAKHSGRRQDGKLALKFDKVDLKTINWTKEDVKFTPCNGDNSRIIEGEELAKLYNNVADKYFVLKITSDMPNSKDSIEKLIKKLADPYVDNQGMMNDSSKGLKEMRISAAWLRGYSIDLHIPDTEPPVISIGKQPYGNSTTECTIEYYICLPKPKRVAFVIEKNVLILSDEEKEKNEKEKKELMVQGSCIFEIKEQKSCADTNTDVDIAIAKEAYRKYIVDFSKEISDYDMVVLCTESANKTIPYLSSRHIAYSKDNLAMMINFIDTATKKIDPQDQKSTEEIEAERKDRCIEPIYKLWFDLVFTSEKKDAELSILDEKAEKAKSTKSNRHNGVLLSTTSESNDDFYKSKVIFSTHYTGLKEEMAKEREVNKVKSEKEAAYVAEKYVNAKFVESITGNNSTDRLIRQDEWNAEWKYKHLAAGLLRIAIFDERIFSSIMPMNLKKSKDSIGLNINTICSEIEDAFSDYENDSDDLYDIVHDNVSKLLTTTNEQDEKTNAILAAETSESRREILEESFSENSYIIDSAQVYHEKRTWFYDIRCYEKERRVDILGYNAPIEDTIGDFKEAERKVCVIGSLMKDDANGYKILLKYTKINIQSKFDIIAIHQGILDKVYSTFGIKDEKDEKYKITKVIHDVLSKFGNLDGSSKEYLQNLIIHSGRSKPNEIDMPQSQPFVQFAAIDHAVRDCKFTLSELLLTAHYEKNNSNN